MEMRGYLRNLGDEKEGVIPSLREWLYPLPCTAGSPRPSSRLLSRGLVLHQKKPRDLGVGPGSASNETLAH